MASSYLSPGVYMEEVSSGSKPIEAAGTAVAAFVGFAEKGPVNQPTLVTNWTQFTQNFGGFIPGSYLAHAVYGYFANGGGSALRRARRARTNAAEVPVLRAPSCRPRARRAGPLSRCGRWPPRPAVQPLTSRWWPVPEPARRHVHAGRQARRQRWSRRCEGLTTRRGPTNVATAVKQQSKLIDVEEVRGGRASVLPRQGRRGRAGGGVRRPSVPVAPDDYVGNSADRTGFAGLEADRRDHHARACPT